MNIVTKDYPVIGGDATDEFPHGAFEVVLSAPTLDRDGEIVDSKAFEPLPDHITFDTDHSMTCDSVVGSGTPSYADDGTLRVKGGFASDPRSQTIRQKVADKHIRTTSVTFMAAEREADEKGVQHVRRAELLNGTFTPVPSNRESVVLTAKSIVAKEGRRNSKTDMENIQTAHDAMTAVGAVCSAKAVVEADGKTAPDADTDPDNQAEQATVPSAAETDAAPAPAAAATVEAPDSTDAKSAAARIMEANRLLLG